MAKLLALATYGHGLPDRGVLVVDEAAMIGTRQLARILALAEQAATKVVLAGDHHQLPEIEAGGAFRRLHAELDPVELSANQRQQRLADRRTLELLRAGRVQQAMEAFDAEGSIVVTGDGEDTLERMVDDWWSAASDSHDPTAHGAMLAVRRADVAELNRLARHRLSAAGRLGAVRLHVADQDFAVGDAVVCTRNASALRVHNGLRGQVAGVDIAAGTIELGVGDRDVRRLPLTYQQEGGLLHAYATTIHRVQGADLPRAWAHSGVLYLEAAYTALSRHIQAVRLYQPSDHDVPEWVEHPAVFADDTRTPLQRLIHAVSISRAQHLALDQLDGKPSQPSNAELPSLLAAALTEPDGATEPSTPPRPPSRSGPRQLDLELAP